MVVALTRWGVVGWSISADYKAIRTTLSTCGFLVYDFFGQQYGSFLWFGGQSRTLWRAQDGYRSVAIISLSKYFR